MKMSRTLRTLVIGLACTLPALAMAQWQWIDKDGRKVFSDQSPPADIPAKNIIKQPGGRAPAPSPAAAAAASAVAAEAAVAGASAPRAGASAPKVSGKDKELEEKKRQAEAAEAAKKKAEDEKLAKARAENCARAKQAKAGFDSGERIARINAKGEREYMDDATRASEAKRVQGIVDSECKPL
ncbi:MAG: DUF4124 domain-containing protein [Burkholderiales bacterium]|nr:MAG: DUF4124 domain-containing protein [Burkholderiales bacterium]